MIAKNIELVEFIIKGKRDVGHVAGFMGAVLEPDLRQNLHTLKVGILLNIFFAVELEGRVEGVGIGRDGYHGDEEKWKQAFKICHGKYYNM